jgi:S-adenosylmethionine uptake transporter
LAVNRSSTAAVPFLVASLGIATFSAMDAAMKGLSIALGVYNALFWRMLIGFALAAAFYLVARCDWPEREAMRLHLTRGAVTTVMGLLFFWGIARMPLAEAIALSFVAPLIALYLAAVLLKERVGRQAILASLIGFTGVIVIVANRAGEGSSDLWGAAAIIASALFYAYNIILMRQQALVARPIEIAFFQNLTVLCLLGLATPFLAELPAASHWPALGLSAVLAMASMLLLAWSYARAEAQRLAPVEFTGLVWAALFGFLVFGEEVGIATIIGAALIVTGCVLAARKQHLPAAQAEAAI